MKTSPTLIACVLLAAISVFQSSEYNRVKKERDKAREDLSLETSRNKMMTKNWMEVNEHYDTLLLTVKIWQATHDLDARNLEECTRQLEKYRKVDCSEPASLEKVRASTAKHAALDEVSRLSRATEGPA